MTSPAPDGPTPPRWLDRITVVLLVLSVGLALGAAAPALLAVAGAPLPVTAPPASGRPIALPHRPPEILSQPEGPGALVDPDREPDPDDAPGGQVGFTRVPLTLRELPALNAEVVGQVRAGELVTIPFISGEWALVQYGASGGMLAGWAKKSEIAIR
jgi:hypothetical protein